jgi:hypothetical protein
MVRILAGTLLAVGQVKNQTGAAAGTAAAG